MSLFTLYIIHPQVVPNLYTATNKKRQWKSMGTVTCSITFLYSTFFKISSFVFNRRKNLIHIWNNM